MKLIQEAKDLIDKLEKLDPHNAVSPIIRRLVVELEIRKHLELKPRRTESPELIRVKK